VADERKAFLLRLPHELWKELERWAGEELRSVNGQIEYVLRQAVIKHRSAGGGEDSKGKNDAAKGGED
jgi:hypothetical protein